MMRRLRLIINDTHVASLTDQNGIWALEYTNKWIESPTSYDLCPDLSRSAGKIMDGSSVRPVQWYFDNLLPVEQSRNLLAADAKIDKADAFSLLSHYGAESAGAITLLNSLEVIPEGGMQPLPDEALSERIRNLPRVSLATGAPKRMSLAGAQHKLPVVVKDGTLYEPVGSQPSTHILKPNHENVDHFDNSVANEWFVMTLARRAKLNVPAVHMRRVPDPVYLIERFDRTTEGDQIQRLHVLDACQLLTLDRHYKYELATMETLNRVIEFCRRKGDARIQLFKWLVFNILVGNNDSHLKNLSFYVTPNGYELAPHYDLLCTAIYSTSESDPTPWLSADMTWKVESMNTFGQVTRERALYIGACIGLTSRVAGKLIDEVVSLSMSAAKEIIENSNKLLNAGEMRLIRRIFHGVMQDMSMKLR